MIMREDRLLAIEKQLADQGRVVSTDLADLLHVPVDMIRRDLRDLAARGICRRVYGGAVKPPVTASSVPEPQLAALASGRPQGSPRTRSCSSTPAAPTSR